MARWLRPAVRAALQQTTDREERRRRVNRRTRRTAEGADARRTSERTGGIEEETGSRAPTAVRMTAAPRPSRNARSCERRLIATRHGRAKSGGARNGGGGGRLVRREDGERDRGGRTEAGCSALSLRCSSGPQEAAVVPLDEASIGCHGRMATDRRPCVVAHTISVSARDGAHPVRTLGGSRSCGRRTFPWLVDGDDCEESSQEESSTRHTRP